MVESRISRDVVQRPHGTSLQIGCTKHHGANTGVHYCAGAHHARLERYIKRAVIQTPRTALASSCSQCENFGVRCRITELFTLVARTRNDLTVAHHDGTNRHITKGCSTMCLVERMAHGERIIHATTVRPVPPANSVR